MSRSSHSTELLSITGGTVRIYLSCKNPLDRDIDRHWLISSEIYLADLLPEKALCGELHAKTPVPHVTHHVVHLLPLTVTTRESQVTPRGWLDNLQ